MSSPLQSEARGHQAGQPVQTTRAESPQQPDPGGAERRRSHREPVSAPGTLVSQTPGVSSSPQQILVLDISLHGVGFRSFQRVVRDTIYQIEIGGGPLHLKARCRIVRVRQRGDGAYEVGGEFC